jgi:hypothetical protein
MGDKSQKNKDKSQKQKAVKAEKDDQGNQIEVPGAIGSLRYTENIERDLVLGDAPPHDAPQPFDLGLRQVEELVGQQAQVLARRVRRLPELVVRGMGGAAFSRGNSLGRRRRHASARLGNGSVSRGSARRRAVMGARPAGPTLEENRGPPRRG